MKILNNSLGVMTDMQLSGVDTQYTTKHTEQGIYTVIYTPSRPDYFWGNYIIFSSDYFPYSSSHITLSPKEIINECKQIFHNEFSELYKNNNMCDMDSPEHIAFAWDTPVKQKFLLTTDKNLDIQTNHTSSFTGLLNKMHVLSFSGEMPKSDSFINRGYEFRPINLADYEQENSEWQQLIESKIKLREGFNREKIRNHTRIHFDYYRQLIEQGKGLWFGVFDTKVNDQNIMIQGNKNTQGKLIASLGIFIIKQNNASSKDDSEQVIARFQDIDTHRDYRKQGICSNLIRYAVNYFQQNDIGNLSFKNTEINAVKENTRIVFCIMTDANSDAERVYRSVGFNPVEVLYEYCEISNEWQDN